MIYLGITRATNWVFGSNKSVPLNGPRIIKLLSDVHAHEIFIEGVYNSDPHAGNVLVMSDGRLGLIDYGACFELSHEQRMFLDIYICIYRTCNLY